MKKITFYMVKGSNDNKKDIWSNHKNSLINERDNEFYFDSHYNIQKKIKVNVEYIKFDKSLYDDLIILKKLSIKRAGEISSEEIGKELASSSLEGVIFSQIQKADYERPISIFNFCASLFIGILMGHKLMNGNKRVALSFLILSLRYFGYHLDWSKGIMQNYKYYESVIAKFVEELQNCYNKIDIDRIGSWIKKHSTIALEWRT